MDGKVYYSRSHVVGRLKGDDRVWGYSITSVYGLPSAWSSKNVSNAFGVEEGQDLSGVLDMVEDYLVSRGLERVLYPGRQLVRYADGRHLEGSVGNYSGVLYHGTEDCTIVHVLHSSDNFGHGSHLSSVNQGDMLSLTPNIAVASDFGAFIIKFEANLTVYYLPVDEETLDDVYVPDNCDAVALPINDYEEDEIAIVRWHNYEMLNPVAMLLPVRGELKEYSTRHTEIYGEYDTFLRSWALDVFGDSWVDLEDAIENLTGVSLFDGVEYFFDTDYGDFKFNCDGLEIYLDISNARINVEENGGYPISEDRAYDCESLLSEIRAIVGD